MVRTVQAAALVLLALPGLCENGISPSLKTACLPCDRELRRTLESIQAWRRLNGGQFPERLADLKLAGLLPPDGAICPEVRREASLAGTAHALATSRIEGGDPPGTYEYELSGKVLKSGFEARWLPSDSPGYTRQDVKAELLRRPFFEQIPILRCNSHRAVAPEQFRTNDAPWRNLTVTGAVYWSGNYWEHLWLDDVPYCAREANVLFGLKGPPFHSGEAPGWPSALDLRPWTCAFGDHPWWWNFPMFDEAPNLQWAAHLRPFFQERHGRPAEAGGETWWVDGLVQLQGRLIHRMEDLYRGPGLLAFVWERRDLPVGRSFREAAWLQGTVWTAPAGETAAWLVWRYRDGLVERVPIIYGRTTARFWGDAEQIEGEEEFPEPVWRHHQTAQEVGKERWLRIYRQRWMNPRPETPVETLDFVSHRESPAAPFLIAVNLSP